MPQNDTTAQLSNYTLTKIIRTGLSPLSAMIGTSTYYGQLIGSPILGSINALLFSKKLVIDIWHLNQVPSTNSQLLNSSKKILLGLGTIGLANYSKFKDTLITQIESSITTLSPSTTNIPWSTVSTSTVNPFPPNLFKSNNNTNNELMGWNTFINLNVYGIVNIIAGLTELIPNRFKTIRKITNATTGCALISTGVTMGINNNFDNAYAVPTIIAGVSEIINNLLPIKTTYTNNIELEQNTEFNNETARLINASQTDYDINSIDSINSSTVIWDRSNPYQSTTMRL